MTREQLSAALFPLVALLVLSTTPVGAGRRSLESDRFRVTMIGIDGATWRVVDPLLAAGDLPNMARLIERGVRAPLRSRLPLYSAPVWTTVATGVLRERHGITNFLTSNGRLSASFDRKFPALWTLASGAGRSTAVVGWWVTYPAESVEGVIVSERALKTRDEDMRALNGAPSRGELPRLVYPPEAAKLVADVLGDLLDDTTEEDEKAAVLRRMRAEDAAVIELLNRLRLQMGPFDLEMLLLRGIDPVSHHFWKFFEPDADAYGADERPTTDEVSRYQSAVEDHYRYVDTLLGEFEQTRNSDQIVMLISDHGFEAGRQPFRGDVLSGKHGTKAALHGILVASGGPFRQGERIGRATILDVAPTVLHLLGLPVAENLDGRVLLETFEPAWAASHPVRSVPSYAGPPVALSPHPQAWDPESPVDEKLRQQLRALGYVD